MCGRRAAEPNFVRRQGTSHSRSRVVGIVRHVGVCIYCGAASGLTNEHIVPLSLNGREELGAASCSACMNVTSAIEHHLTRGAWWPHRRRLGMLSRRPKEQPDSFPAVCSPDEAPDNVKVAAADYPFLLFPDFGRPAMALGERGDVYKGATGVLATILKAGPVTIDRSQSRGLHRPDSRVKLDVNLDFDKFVRFLAKLAHAKAIAVYGLEAFAELYLRQIVLGALDEVNSFIGRASSLLTSDLPGLEHFRTQVFEHRGQVHVYIQCFAQAGIETPVYEVVAGKLRRADV
jgi:hypothetical protein